LHDLQQAIQLDYGDVILKGEKPMILVNETQQDVTYEISTASGSLHDQGTIEVDGVADLPEYDNQTNVSVQFFPEAGGSFFIEIGDTKSDNQVEMALVAE
jgi:hypothetical protein